MILNQLARTDFHINGKEIAVFYDPSKNEESEISRILNTGHHEALLDIMLSEDISVTLTSHANFLMDESNKESITTFPMQYLS